MTVDSVFVRHGAGFAATELARGPWDPGALHGGAPAALLARELERWAPGPELVIARITYEFVRPVPLGPLAVTAQLVRPARRVTLLDGAITDGAGTEVVRARALLLRPSDIGAGEAAAPVFPGPDDGRMTEFGGGRLADVRHPRNGDPLRRGGLHAARAGHSVVSAARAADRRGAGFATAEPGRGG